MSKALRRLAQDSATINVEPSAVMAMPLPNAMLSATCWTEPSGRTSATSPDSAPAPVAKSKPPPLT